MDQNKHHYFNVAYFRSLFRISGIYLFSVLMKNFLKVFITISSITILLMFFLDKGYSHAFKNAQHRSKINNILQSKNKHYDVAFFGSSRTKNHIDCKLITELTGKSCINF